MVNGFLRHSHRGGFPFLRPQLALVWLPHLPSTAGVAEFFSREEDFARDLRGARAKHAANGPRHGRGHHEFGAPSVSLDLPYRQFLGGNRWYRPGAIGIGT